jgi:hypothetical protein
VPLNTEYRLAFRLSRGTTRHAWIVRNFRVTADNGDDDAVFFHQSFLWWAQNELMHLWNDNVILDTTVVSLSSTPTTTLFVGSGSLQGTYDGTENLPDQVAALIRLTVGTSDIRHPAKVFIPYVPVVDTEARVLGWLDGLDYSADKLAQDMGGIDGPTTIYSPAKWSRGAGTSQLISDGEASREYWTQRRRVPRGIEALLMYPMVP